MILSFLISKVPLVMRSGIVPSVSGAVQLGCAARFAGRIPMEVPPMPTTDQRAEGCFLQEQVVHGEAGVDVNLLGVGHPRAPCCAASRRFEVGAHGLEQLHPLRLH